MPRLIFKCPYIRGGSSRAAPHLSNYVRYMATREGAQRLDTKDGQRPATEEQVKLVEQLVRDFPLSKGLFEYEDYQSSPTRSNASEFVTRALEDNYDQISKKDNYIQYIAHRPRAQRTGDHALFTGSDDPLVLSQIAEEVAHHPGNVWLPILSLRREDAARLGYDDAGRWKELLTGYAMELAQAMKIPWEQFRWYAAFHDEGHHPHVHMVCYSADGKSGYLTRQGISEIRAGLAKQIFRQELYEIYERQTQRRDGLTQQAGQALREFIEQMESGPLEHPKIELLMDHLSAKLKTVSGKKQYGYLKAPLKSLVDEIVDELAKDPRVAQAYDLWYQMREEVLRTYKDDLPERLPLSRQKEFKQIRNFVIREAVRLDELRQVFLPEEPQEGLQAEPNVQAQDTDAPNTEHTESKKQAKGTWRYTYRRARAVLADPASTPEQLSQALQQIKAAAEHDNSGSAAFFLGKACLSGTGMPRDPAEAARWLELAAQQGNQYAQYQLGKLLLQGEGVPKDAEAAVRWLTASAQQGNQYAQYALGKIYLLGEDAPQDSEAAARWFTLSAAQGNAYAQTALDHTHKFQGSPLLASVTQLLYHMANIFRGQEPHQPVGPIRFTDKKLRRKIREKKIAMGHKPDDHEPTITM